MVTTLEQHGVRSPRRVARAEGVGSLVRPAAVQALMRELYEGRTAKARALVMPERAITMRALNEACDAALAEIVQRQIDAGLDVVTDGELRRANFLSTLYDAVGGIVDGEAPEGVSTDTATSFVDPQIGERLRLRASPLAAEVAAMRCATRFPFKVTLPAPSYLYLDFISMRPDAYRDRDALIDDVVAIEQAIVADAIAEGARWIQFDFPVYPALVDEQAPALLQRRGETADSLLRKAIAADTAVLQGLPPGTVTALHLCRGNFAGGFWSGSLGPIAAQLFSELPHDRFLFEWDDVTLQGDYAPIRDVPAGKVMVLGLVDTGTPVLEADDEIVRRLDEAARHLDLDQLALSPQCGFGSAFGYDRGHETQWRKLELVGRVADRVWGAA